MSAPTSAGLFAGIGGIEYGLERAGFRTSLLCEIDGAAQSVLRHHFPGVRVEADVRTIKELPKVDVLSAGFPCQDLSQAGRTAGIGGSQSSLVEEVFRLLADKRRSPRWLILENVSFMLRLDRGAAMEYVASSLEALGFRWAYRVLDSRAFGVPQRRQRVVLLASRTEDPRPVLFGVDSGEPYRDAEVASAFGFYWTEGLRGVGWAVDAVPTLKGGSTIGIPSPPAVWYVEDGRIVTPDIRDAERLQGFPEDWTACVGAERRDVGRRWKLVGNAVTSTVAHWVGSAILDRSSAVSCESTEFTLGTSWPAAAWGERGLRLRVLASAFPGPDAHPPLSKFLQYAGRPLSARAATGFLSRARMSSLRFRTGFLDALEAHRERMLEVAESSLLPQL